MIDSKSERPESLDGKASLLSPMIADISQKKVSLGLFYDEVLFRTGSVNPELFKLKPLTQVIKNVSLSAWNPPPSQRRLRGDLLYIEIISSEDGIFQITATSSGFFVNSSTRAVFDPRPAMNPCFSHELLTTIIGCSPGFRAAWTSYLSAIDAREVTLKAGALDLIATLYTRGMGDSISVSPPWLLPPDQVFKYGKLRLSIHLRSLN